MRTNEPLLIRTLVELADNLVADFDVVELLSHLTERCIEVLDVAAAGVMLASPSGSLQLVASSSEMMRSLELFEIQADEGPCLDCYGTGELVSSDDLSAAGRIWPHFAPRAISDGFASVHAVALRLRGQTLGALNLFRREPGPLGELGSAAAQGLADIATIAIIQHEVAVDAQTLNVQLNEALNSRIVIEQAKGRISQAVGVDMDTAFTRLRAHARSHNIRLSALAVDIASGALRPDLIE